MVMDKKNEDKALLEMKMAMNISSPFILNASYAYIDNKDLVLALRMMPGGASRAHTHSHCGAESTL